MQAHQFIRYKAMDRCFRDTTHDYTIDELMGVCTNAIRDYHGDPDQKTVGRRTIELDLQNLKDYQGVVFDEEIGRKGRKKVYRYEDTTFSLVKQLLDNGELEKMLLDGVLDTLALYDDVPQYKWLYMFLQQRANGIKADQTQAIEFQNNPDLMGMDHFSTLLDAIVRKQSLLLTYKPYGKDPQELPIHPYMLKQFNDRWNLIARIDQGDKIMNYPVDRIREVKPLDVPFQEANVDFEEYFKPIIGVSRNETDPIEDIVIRFKKKRFNYVRTKPIHSSQEIVHHLSDADYTTIKLHMQINNELEAMILSYGNDAEVIEPASFRERIGAKIIELAEMYKIDKK